MVRLTVTHEQLDADMRQKVSAGWPRVLSSLKSLGDGQASCHLGEGLRRGRCIRSPHPAPGTPMPDLKHQIAIDASPDAVYAPLATEAGLAGWWTADARADEAAGGRAEFGFHRRSAVFTMRIDALDPGKEVCGSCLGGNPEWTGTTLRWTIAPE